MKPIEIKIALGAEAIDAISTLIKGAVEAALPKQTQSKESPSPDSLAPPAAPPESPQGAAVTQMDRVSASELRSAYLLGKLPDDGSLLIDTKRVSALLNVSPRTVFRLNQEKAMPEPIKIGNKVQWRIREIIEWVEADCPPRKFWQYSEGQGKRKR